MEPDNSGLSATNLIALAEECLLRGEFSVARDTGSLALSNGRALLAEDDYSVLAVVAYDTWDQLDMEWAEAQAELVSLLSQKLARSAPKAWDGYLVLLCAAPVAFEADAEKIERDTNRIRKIVATGDRLRTTSDVASILDLFMPLEIAIGKPEEGDVLLSLPTILAETVEAKAVEVLVSAYRTSEPLLERLHDFVNGASS